VGFGNDLPGATTDFGRNAQYGTLLSSTYLTFGGAAPCTETVTSAYSAARCRPALQWSSGGVGRAVPGH
jgi:hypothetical protein